VDSLQRTLNLFLVILRGYKMVAKRFSSTTDKKEKREKEREKEKQRKKKQTRTAKEKRVVRKQ